MRVLVTGGAGFIGSHTVVALIEAGHDTVVIDNLSNARRSVIDRIGQLTGTRPKFIEADIRQRDAVDSAIGHGIDACMHFAALKSVPDSVARPLAYYANNVGGTIELLDALAEADVRSLVFSSSATVYGDPTSLPLDESMPVGAATNPYGWSKIMMERTLIDMQHADSKWSVSMLRYFNPVGAHPSGLLGEDPKGTPGNLMPYVARVAAGLLPKVIVYGDDYDTPDGTGVRDYIHVVDLALGHVKALEEHHDQSGTFTYNLGTGKGHSVLEVINAYEQASGKPVPYEVAGRRPGDVAATWADVSRADKKLGWRTERTLDDMCADSWRWQLNAH